jgi:RNA polymerase sigma factor (sigma-70 family)
MARQHAPANEVDYLYQEIRYQLWKGLDQFEGRSSLETWGHHIAMYTISSYKRKNFRRNRALRTYEQRLPTEQPGGRDEEQMLIDFAQSLPKAERKLFEMHLSNTSYQEIAKLAGISEPVLRVKISRRRNQFEQRYLCYKLFIQQSNQPKRHELRELHEKGPGGFFL